MPANIRVASRFPFPALVVGAAPVAVTKLNGVWTISLNVAGLAVQTPPPANYATDYFIMYDSVAATYFKVPLLGSAFGRARVQRSVIASPIVVAASDEILNCNINATAACALPAAATRSGLPLTFVDVGLHAQAHNITLTPNGAETIVNAASPAAFVMNSNGQSVTLVPFNDSVNSGWSIQ